MAEIPSSLGYIVGFILLLKILEPIIKGAKKSGGGGLRERFKKYTLPVRPSDSVPILKYRKAVFLTETEAKFITVLTSFVRGRAHVLAKVRLSDLALPEDSPNFSAHQTAMNKVQSKHVDFVLCGAFFRPLCVIELDDSSHFLPSRMRRDDFVDLVFKDIGLPIFHIPVKSSYTGEDFKALDRVLELK